MPVDIPLDKAYLTAVWLETAFYGMNFVLFFSYLYVVRYGVKAPFNWFTFISAVFMFVFSTIHVSFEFQRLIEGFINMRNQPGGPAAFFSDVSVPANVAKVCIHTINSILGDSILVWRCYHVWGRNWWICVFPILLILASASCAFGQTVYLVKAKDVLSTFEIELERWTGALFVLSFSTNVIVTTLIAFRIWYLSKSLNIYADGTMAKNKYGKVLALVIESGAIYSAAILFEIVLYFLNSNAFYIVHDPACQLTGMVPTMIIVMSGLGLTTDDSRTASRGTRGSLRFAPRAFHSYTGNFTASPEMNDTATTAAQSTSKVTSSVQKPQPRFVMIGHGFDVPDSDSII